MPVCSSLWDLHDSPPALPNNETQISNSCCQGSMAAPHRACATSPFKTSTQHAGRRDFYDVELSQLASYTLLPYIVQGGVGLASGVIAGGLIFLAGDVREPRDTTQN